jgi:hypothetical protein
MVTEKISRKIKMDFKSLINKISSMEDTVSLPQAPVLPQAVQLNEDAQLRVLSGRSTYVAEAKKKAEDDKKEEAVKEEMKVGDTKKTAKGGTVTKTKTGITHKAGPGSYGGSDDKDTDPDADDDTPKGKKGRKRSNEAIDTETFKGKFAKMVEAKKDEKKDTKKKPMKEAAKPDFLDIDKDGDKKEPMKKAAADKGGDKKDGKKGMSAKQEKFFGKKKTVKESVEQKLTFKQMVALVQESGGQQAIDPTDKELFAWAQRVAQTKFQESMKAEVYAGLVYERMGGVFEMYDVLSEEQNNG